MADYTTITINAQNLKIDPESISVQITNLVSVDRSLGGTSYVTSLNTNTPSANRMVTISGIMLPETYLAALRNSAVLKIPISVGGGILGTTGNFIIMSLSHDPIKPKPLFSDETDPTGEIKYRYNMTLQEVD